MPCVCAWFVTLPMFITPAPCAHCQNHAGCAVYISGELFYNSGNKYFLFEGACTNGSGELVLTISQKWQYHRSTGAWLDLHDIKDFYERAVITNIYNGQSSNWSSTIESAASYIVGFRQQHEPHCFCSRHKRGWLGWFDDVTRCSKRLYWAGYQGKLPSVKWPCHFLTPPDVWDLDVFNYSELNAYKSQLRNDGYLNQLRTRFSNLPPQYPRAQPRQCCRERSH